MGGGWSFCSCLGLKAISRPLATQPLSPHSISLTAYILGSEKFEALQSEVKSMLAKNAIEEVKSDFRGFYNRLFVVAKSTGGWRPVLDVSALNKFVRLTKFKMESPTSVLNSIEKGDWMASIDLKDAYFQVPVHPDSKKFLRFVFGGKVFQFRALCFGLSTAPQVFTRVFAQVARWLHLQNVRVLFYLDDWLVLNQSRELLLENLDLILRMSIELGFLINVEKSCLIPSQKVVYLGMVLDSANFWVSPRERRVSNFLSLLAEFRSCAAPSARLWQRLLGHMTSLERFVVGARLRTRVLQFHLRRHWDMVSLPESTFVSVPRLALQDLEWWGDVSRLSQGVPIRQSHRHLCLYSDASTQGWGATLEGREVSGLWSPLESSLHINVLELRAVRLALLHFASLVQGRSVVVFSDNTTALAYIRKQGGTRSWSLYLEARTLLLWAFERSILLSTCFVPGERNVLADRLSRQDQVLPAEWTLHSQVCASLWRLWGTPHLDAFATRDNHRLPLFVSPVRDSLAWSVDARVLDWNDAFLYAYPPLSMIPEVLKWIAGSRNLRVIMVAPYWPARQWFIPLFQLSADQPRLLPQRVDLLRQPYSPRKHGNLSALALTGWLLSSDGLERRDFRRRLLLWRRERSEHLLQSSISASGLYSGDGAWTGEFPPPRPL
ncbi:MAG: reverse transcriptase domain-containing protein, partial [Cyanobacteria bacterium J06582_2]